MLFWFGLRSVAIGSLVITLHPTWSPWHYTAQSYGVALMLLKRRGATPSALAIVSLHRQETPPYTPDGISGYQFRVVTLGMPTAIRDAAIAIGSVA